MRNKYHNLWVGVPGNLCHIENMCPEIRQKVGLFMSNKTLIELWLQSHGYWLHDTRLKSRFDGA